MRMNVALRLEAVLVLLAVVMASQAALAGSAAQYVQDGLLACWDGFENAGAGTHDASAAVWKDLVAGREFALNNVTVAEDSMVFAGTQSSYGELSATDTAATFGNASNGMVEIVYASFSGVSSYVVLQSSAASGIALGQYDSRFIAISGDGVSAPMFPYAAGLATNSVAIRYSSAKPVKGWGWCNPLGTTSNENWSAPSDKTTIGTRSSRQNNPFNGAIYCIRVYSRPLTVLEIAANCAVDRRRFIERGGGEDRPKLDGVSLDGFSRGAAIVARNLGSETQLTNFPVLVRISPDNFSGFDYGDLRFPSSARDIAFTDDQGRGLAYDIDTWDTDGTSLVWVTVPVLTNGTKIAMFYRSSTPGKSVCEGNAFTNYVGVWHMNETPDGVTDIFDSTTNDLRATTVETSRHTSDGIVGGARYVTDTDVIEQNDSPVAPFDSGVTVDMTGDEAKVNLVDSILPVFSASFWIRSQIDTPRFWYLVARRDSDKGTGWAIQTMYDNATWRFYGGSESDGSCRTDGNISLPRSKWTKIDAVWNNQAIRIYKDGFLSIATTLGKPPSASQVAKIGLGGSIAPQSSNLYSGRGVMGDMDEFRLCGGMLSENWIAVSYAQELKDSLLAYGAVEIVGGSGLAIIVR